MCSLFLFKEHIVPANSSFKLYCSFTFIKPAVQGNWISVQIYRALIVPGMISQILQYDMWDKTPTDLWDWAALKEKIAKLVTTLHDS